MILDGEIIGLDLGSSRTGTARINLIAKIAEPLAEIDMYKQNLSEEVSKLIEKLNACAVVVGVPRGLDGQETDQTRWAETLKSELESQINVPIFGIDEAGTTKQAETRVLSGQSVDSVAAGIILEDFVAEVEGGRIENVSF